MGNRTFLYTADALPTPGGDQPALCESVAEGNNCLPPLWLALFSAAQPGPAQDFQQIFLPSLAGGIYAPRALGEQRMFALLDFIATHPLLPDPASLRRKTDALRSYLATLSGEVYSADLNEWFHMGQTCDLGEDPMDKFIGECGDRWADTERAIERADYVALEKLYAFKPREAADMLGFRCWSHAYFDGWEREDATDTFDEFCLTDDTDDDDPEGQGRWVGHDMHRFREGDKFGLRRSDEERTLLLPPIYDSIDEFADGMRVATLVLDDVWGLYDANGKVVLEPVIDEMYDFEDDVALAKVGDLFGYIDGNGAWLVEPRYDEAFDFSEGMALVVRNGLSGYIDRSGAEVIAPRYLEGCDSFVAGGYAQVETARGYGVIDRSGRFVIAAGYADIVWLEDLEAWSATNAAGDSEVFLGDGTPWFSGTFDEIDCVEERGDALVNRGGLHGTRRRDGEPGIPIAYRCIVPVLVDGATRIYEVTGADDHELCGACLVNGELLIPLQFSSIDPLVIVPYQDTSAAGWVGHPARHLVVTDDLGRGVWSLDAARQVLACQYDDVYGCRIGAALYFLGFNQGRGWTLADVSGNLLNQQPYTWLGDRWKTGSEDYHAMWIGGDLVKTWGEGEPINGWCDNGARRLYPDGREESDLDFQLARAYDPRGTPIVPLDAVVGGLPLPAGGARPLSHLIAGVCDPDACNALGNIYANGLGVEADQEKACRWYATGAAGGNREARYSYGFHLMQGRGCAADPFAARDLFEALGPEHRIARADLGYLYECSLGSECDPEKARAFYTSAGDGETQGHATAQYNLGHCWRYGKGGPLDLHMALRYYEWAQVDRAFSGAPGHHDAARAAAEVHCELALEAQRAGRPVVQDQELQRGIYFYKKMLGYGLNGALIGLASCYLGVYGGQTDLKLARGYLRQAMEDEQWRDEARTLWDAHRLGPNERF